MIKIIVSSLFMSISITFILIYLNLLSYGYTFIEYLKYIVCRYEVVLPLLISIIILIKKRKIISK
jgi:hypothetical protein